MLNWNAFGFRGLISLSLLLAGGSAPAQIPAGQPPVRELVDANGVDLLTGEVTSTFAGPSIGLPGSSLGFVRYIRESNSWDSFLGAITAGTGTRLVSVEGESVSFTESGGVFISAEGTGETLTFSGGVYTFTSRSGTLASFQERTTDYAHPGNAVGLLTSITRPNGEIVSVAYANEIICETYVHPNCTLQSTAARVVSVTSNHGYQLSMTYPTDPGGIETSKEFYFSPIQVTLKNLTTGATVGTMGFYYYYIQTHTYVMELSDTLGRVTKYTIDENYGINSIRRPGSTIDNTTVVRNGATFSVTHDGITTNYSHSIAGGIRTIASTNAAGGTRVVTSEYASGRVLTDRNELNKTTTYTYDSQGRLSRVTAPEGNFVEYSYDARGNVTQTRLRAKPGSGLADIVTTAGFDTVCANPKTCNQPNWTRDAKANQTDYTYASTHGGVLTKTLPVPASGAIRPQVRNTYTALEAWYLNASGVLAASGQPIHLLSIRSECRTLPSCTGSSDEIKTTIGYGSSGAANNRWALTFTKRDGTGTLVSTHTFAYDVAGNLLTVDGPLPGSADTRRTRYDSLRRTTGAIGPDPDGTGPRTPVALRYTYGTTGDLVTVEKGTVNSQGDADWSTFAPLETRTMQYDAAGRRTRTSVSSSATTHTVEQVSYDGVGRLQCTAIRLNAAAFGSLPASACTLGTTGTVGPDRITRNTFDAASQLTKVTTGYGSPNAIDVVTNTHTSNGKVFTMADGRNGLTTLEYDGFDRLHKIRFPSPTTPGTSSTADYEQFTYDASCNVTTHRMRSGQQVTFVPDDLNRVVLKDLPGGSSEDTYISYDNQGRPLAILFGSPTGIGITSTYDGLGRLSSRTTFSRTLSYAYDASGRQTRVTHPGGFYAEYVFNAADELTSITDSTGTTLATYSYDALGRRNHVTRGNSTTTNYTYDAISRLAALSHDFINATYDSTAGFTRSPSSQIVARTQTNDATYVSAAPASSLSLTFNGLNQLTMIGAAPVNHDTLANLTAGDTTYTYGYDIENRLRSAVLGSTTVSIAYDPLALLSEVAVATTAGTTITKFLYDGMKLVAEYGDTGAVLRRYVHGTGMDEPIALYEGAGTSDRRYLHADERRSIIAVSNNSGSGILSFKYSPDGASANADAGRFGFTGQIWLPHPGLYYYKTRMYSPRLGRFLQPDAIGYAGGMNLYAYVDGDPINLVDSLGFVPEDPDNRVPSPPCQNGLRQCFPTPTFNLFAIQEQDIAAMDAWEAARDANRSPEVGQPSERHEPTGLIGCARAANKWGNAAAECRKERGTDIMSEIRFIEKYATNGSGDTAMIGCICTKITAEQCTKLITECGGIAITGPRPKPK